MESLIVIGSFIRAIFEITIRGALFALPVAYVAKLCGVPPTWESAAFMAFCLFWCDAVSGKQSTSGERHDPPPPEKPRRTAVLLTPAEVATEARKLTQRG